ncbi:MAG: glycosyltransferase [Myxococcales bacterium]
MGEQERGDQERGGGPLRGRDIVCFSNDWSGDPLSKTHLMRGLARDNRVLWIDSLGNRTPSATARDVRRLVRKAGTWLQGLREVEPNLHVFSPLCLPLFGPGARAANGVLLRSQLRAAMAWLGFGAPISWTFLPAAAAVAGQLGESLVLYHCVDDFSAFSGTPSQAIAELEADLCRRADLVLVSAEKLLRERRVHNPETVLVRHGVDYAHFAKALDDRTPLAAEMAGLPRPVLGFFGLIADWVDVELLRRVALHFREGSLVLLGSVTADVSLLRALPNVHLLGRRRYAELPGFAKGFDVALLPFRINALTLAANPLKVREYLAAGLPVVSTAVPEVEALGLCRIARGPEAFLAEIEAALREGAGPNPARSRLLAGESWEARLADIRAHVGRVEAKKRRASIAAP